MTTDHARLTNALTEAAKSIHEFRSLEETLDSIVQAAVLAMPGFEHAGISFMHGDGRIETVAGTDQLVWELDALQYEISEGPCVDAITNDDMVVVEDLTREHRWPRYVPTARDRGVQAQLGLHLYRDATKRAGINLYSTEHSAVDPDDINLAELFATQAAVALGRARAEDTLSQAVATRGIIGQAVGIVSERYSITGDRAFRFLVRASQSANVKLRAVAQEIVDSTDERYGSSSTES